MNMIACAVKVYGSGEGFEAIVNGIVNPEIQRQNEVHRRELARIEEELTQVTKRRNRELAEKRLRRRAEDARRVRLVDRLKQRAVDAWALVVGSAMVYGSLLRKNWKEHD